MRIFENILPAGTKNNKLPAKNDRGFIYTGTIKNEKMEQRQAWNRKELRRQGNEQYVTASAFWNPNLGRTAKNLRWINALVLDFDTENGKEIDKHELALKIADAGLPPASAFIRTPSGGIHVWWWLKPVRATPKAVRLFTALQTSMAQELGADMGATGAERFWRLPTAKNVIYSGRKKYKLSVFRRWRDEFRPEDMPGQRQTGHVYAFTRGLLVHPGVKKIMEGVGMGQRNEACFSIVVAHLISGYSVPETEQILKSWNQKNSPPMRDREVLKCVKSAAKGLKKDYTHYYNAMRFKIKNITGITVKYRPLTAPKSREERKRSHIKEWKQDLIAHLQECHGRKLTTLRRLAKELNMPYSTLKVVLNKLENEGTIYRDSVQRGRKSFTILILQSASTSAFVMGHTGIHYGGQKPSGPVELTGNAGDDSLPHPFYCDTA